eukprot:344913-Pelagomonas_calceolata.AAC.2
MGCLLSLEEKARPLPSHNPCSHWYPRCVGVYCGGPSVVQMDDLSVRAVGCLLRGEIIRRVANMSHVTPHSVQCAPLEAKQNTVFPASLCATSGPTAH